MIPSLYHKTFCTPKLSIAPPAGLLCYPVITYVIPRLTEDSGEGEEEGGGTIDNGTKTVVVATGVQALQPEGLPGQHFIERESGFCVQLMVGYTQAHHHCSI